MRYFIALVAASSAIVLALPQTARADIAPPPGYVEQCTLEKLQKDGTKTCQACSTYFREPDKCEQQFAKTAYTKACRAGGASTWTEMWCKPKGKDDKDGPLVPQAPPSETPPEPAPAEPAPDAPKQEEPEPVEQPTLDRPTDAPTKSEPVVKAADVAPKRDSKCGAGGLELGLSMLGALFLLVRRRP